MRKTIGPAVPGMPALSATKKLMWHQCVFNFRRFHVNEQKVIFLFLRCAASNKEHQSEVLVRGSDLMAP
jgi:hypothetical protein